MESITYDLNDSVGTLTINRAEKYNSLGGNELQGLQQALDLIAADSEVRVLIVTGAGDKTFCAGAALDELNSGRITPESFQLTMQRVAELPSCSS